MRSEFPYTLSLYQCGFLLLEVVPVLAIFDRLTLDFRESKCFLREPETLVEMKEQLQKFQLI